MPVKIIDYDLVTSSDYQEVIREVREMIARGWEPLGPCQISQSYGDDEAHWDHVQTMVRYEQQ
jgi:hypothetical protein